MGYRYPAPIIRYEGEEGTPFEGLWIEVRKVRTGAEFKALTGNRLWKHLFEVVAPFVVGWNVEGAKEVVTELEPATDDKPAVVQVTSEVVTLPPPAEAGWEILQLVEDYEVLDWILLKLIESTYHRLDDPKAPTPLSGSTPAGTPTGTTKKQTTLKVMNGESGESNSTEPKTRRTRRAS